MISPYSLPSFLKSLYESSRMCAEHYRKICLQYLSLHLYLFFFLHFALTCLVLSVILTCHMIKLSLDIGHLMWHHYMLFVYHPWEIQNHPDLLWKIIYWSIELILISAYLVHWTNDWDAQERGSHPIPQIRRLPTWKYIADYFPIRMVLSRSLRNNETVGGQSGEKIKLDDGDGGSEIFDPQKNYLVGYHPHGILGLGAVVNFGSEANQFSKRFPGIQPWLTTLEINFKTPVQRDLMLSTYTVSATYNGIMYLLDPKKCGRTGNFVVVVLGGADEALDSRPLDYVFHMNKRYGFFKIALLTGSDLVPCVSFGEPNMYKQVWNPKGSWLRTLQERFTKRMTFSPPLFYAKWITPYRSPVTTVIGDPIPVEKNENPTREQVAALKERYCQAVKDLFKEFKPIFDPNGKDVVFV